MKATTWLGASLMLASLHLAACGIHYRIDPAPQDFRVEDEEPSPFKRRLQDPKFRPKLGEQIRVIHVRSARLEAHSTQLRLICFSHAQVHVDNQTLDSERRQLQAPNVADLCAAGQRLRHHVSAAI